MQAERDITLHIQMWKQRVILEHHADIALLRWQRETGSADQLVMQVDCAAADRLEAGDAAQGRRLAAAGWPEQATDLAFAQSETKVGERGALLVHVRHRIKCQQRFGRRSSGTGKRRHAAIIVRRPYAQVIGNSMQVDHQRSDCRDSNSTGIKPTSTNAIDGRAARSH